MANWAVVIGVNDYPAQPEWGLRGAVRDALGMRAWLLDPAGGNVPPENLVLLLSPRATDDVGGVAFVPATYDNMVNSIEDMIGGSGGAGERIYFHFAGHGMAIDTDLAGKEGILASDVTAKLTTKSITLATLFQRFLATRFSQQFFFIDACRNIPFDNVRLADYPDKSPALRPASPQFIMYATQQGAKAKEIDESGAFTSTLLKALRGAGSAKSWDEGGAEYVMRWSSVFAWVAKQVRAMKLRADAAPGGPMIQVPRQFGEHGEEDPELGRLAADKVPDEKLTIDVAPSPQVCPVANISINALDQESVVIGAPITAPVVRQLRPKTYGIIGRARGYKPARTPAVPLYEMAQVTLQFEEDPASATTRGSGTLARHLGVPPIDLFTAALDFGSSASQPGALRVRAPEQLALIQVADESGALKGSGRGELYLANLPFGFYTMRLLSPEGVVVSEVVDTPMPGGVRDVPLMAPDSLASPAMQRVVQEAGFFQSGGVLFPSEAMGPAAFLKLSTVLALSVAAKLESESSAGYHLRQVSLPRFEVLAPEGPRSGVYLVFGDERSEAYWKGVVVYDATEGARQPLDHAKDASGQLVAFAAARSPGARSLSIVRRTREMTLPCHVLPDRVTVFVFTREMDGSVEMHEYMPLHDPANAAATLPASRGLDPYFPGSAFAAIRRIEYMQRAFAKGRVSPLKPDIELLLYDKWVDPIAGALGGYLAERLGIDEGVDMATGNLVKYFGELPDSHILRGSHLRRSGRIPEAIEEFRIAVMRGMPVFSDGAAMLRDLAQSMPLEERLNFAIRNVVGEGPSTHPWSMLERPAPLVDAPAITSVAQHQPSS